MTFTDPAALDAAGEVEAADSPPEATDNRLDRLPKAGGAGIQPGGTPVPAWAGLNEASSVPPPIEAGIPTGCTVLARAAAISPAPTRRAKPNSGDSSNSGYST
jgi:hypothetical protein